MVLLVTSISSTKPVLHFTYIIRIIVVVTTPATTLSASTASATTMTNLMTNTNY